MNNKTSFILPLVIAGLLSSCAGGGGGPQRKKMPDFVGSGNEYSNMHLFENDYSYHKGNNGAQFQTSLITLSYNGSPRECISVDLPPAVDEQVAELIQMYKPFTTTLLDQWSKTNKNTLVIDFSDGSAQRRTDYIIKNSGRENVPVTVLWNSNSEKRISFYLSQLTSVPGISIEQVK